MCFWVNQVYLFLSQSNIFINSPRWIFIPSRVSFVISPVQNLLLGLIPEKFGKFGIFSIFPRIFHGVLRQGVCIIDNLLDYWKPHLHIPLKKKKPVSNNKVVFSEKKLPLNKNSRIRSLTYFQHQTSTTVAPPFWESISWVNQAFKHL